MAPISKKRAAMEMHLCHTLVPSLNMTGYSSDSSNQGGSETSNSSSQNLPLGSLLPSAAAAANESSLQLSALSSLSALGLASHQPHLSALHQLNHSQLMSNLSGLAGAAAAAAAAAAAVSSASGLTGTSSVLGTAGNSSSNGSGLTSALNASGSQSGNMSGSGSDSNMTLGKQYAKVNRVVLDKNSDEYRRRRERNNLAVKKSRTKSKMKTLQTLERVKQLKAENEELIQKIDILTKELRLLKDLFVAHASNAHGANITEIDLALLTSSEALQEVPLNLNGKFNGLFNSHVHQ